jgi:hypothetical protein
MTRILVFSPYALWKVHTIYEETIAKSCQAQGASVEYLLCDGLSPECDLHWDSKSNSPRPLDLCQRCQAVARTSLDTAGFPYRWLGEFVTPAERTAAFDWAQSIAPADFRHAEFDRAPLGEWVLASVISYFRQYPPDLGNLHVVSVYRGFLNGAAVVATGLRRYLESNAIDAALLFNGRQSLTRAALEMLRMRGIRVLTHERAEYQRGHISLKPNAHCMSTEPFKAFWSMWAQTPLDRKALDAALNWLIQRRYGANLAWIAFNRASVSGTSLRTTLNLNPNKHLWALFTSSTDETAGDPLMRGPFESQAAWVQDVVRWVGARDDVQLVIKVHPNLAGNLYIGKAVSELNIYEQLKRSLPNHIRVVMPEDSLSAYALAEEADVGLTFGSTIGLEMAMLGKPVLLASRAFYEIGSRILTVRTRQSLSEMLERCLKARPDRELQREAFRLAYYYIFVFELPFPAVKVLHLFDAQANYSRQDDLARGKDASLDRICRHLVDGHAFFDGPSREEQSRTTADEDAFFEELSRKPDYLMSVRYERWLKLQSLGGSARKVLARVPLGAGDALADLGRGRWKALLRWMERKA